MLCLWPGLATAITNDPAALCDQAALAEAERAGIPPQVMLAITRVETGRNRDGGLQPWPWTINQGGEGHWFATVAEAIAFAAPEIDAGTTNMDIGCFQLNLRWHAGAFSSLDQMFDPMANAAYAADFLTDLHQRKGNWVDAVAAYHSETPEHAANYIEKVESVLSTLSTLPETSEGPEQRENLFPLLQAGQSGAMASLVPAGHGATPLFAMVP